MNNRGSILDALARGEQRQREREGDALRRNARTIHIDTGALVAAVLVIVAALAAGGCA